MQMHKQKTQHMNMGMAAHTAEAMIVHVYTNDQMQCHMPSTSVMCYFGILHMCYFRNFSMPIIASPILAAFQLDDLQ